MKSDFNEIRKVCLRYGQKIRAIIDFLGFFSFIHLFIKREVPYRFRSHSHYAQWEYETMTNIAEYLKIIKFKSGSYQLDVGCGFGGGTIAQAKRETTFVVGLDIDWERLKIAQKLAKEKSVNNVSFVLGDARNLCFRNESFDSLISVATFEHLKMPYVCLKEINRVLREKGSVYICFNTFWGPNGGHLYVYLPFPWVHYLPKTLIQKFLSKAPKLGTATPKAVYNVYLLTNRLSTREFTQLVKASGLRIECQHSIGLPFRKIINRLEGRLHDFFILQHSYLLTKSDVP